MAAVTANDVIYLYRTARADVAALRGLSLEVEDGEIVAVLGPSGSGKTTLLGLCSGSRRPSSGELSVLGHAFERASARESARVRRDSIGLVRQHYHRALPRELTAEEIVGLPLRLRSRFGRDERARVAELMRAAGLERRARAHPAELSGGEQQRVAVCAALVTRPRLLLADEPTGELDAGSTRAVVELVLELVGDTGAAALIVTHDPEVALSAQRTIHIRDGRLAAEGGASPVLIVDEQGWLRLPRRVRDEAGVRERVRARARWGTVELVAEDPEPRAVSPSPPLVPDPAQKRYETDVALVRVGKRYDEVVLSELSWTFESERLHVLAGPSGSGKTTLLNLMAALDYPDSGEVWIGGQRTDALNPNDAALLRQRLLGYVSQHSTLVDFLSARENVELGLAARGFDPEEGRRRAVRWLEWAGLAKLAERRAEELSGGEQRRVALARALAPGPRILLADEPTAHLDRLTGRHVIRLLQQTSAELGTTVIAATHDPDLIAAADRRLELPLTASHPPPPGERPSAAGAA